MRHRETYTLTVDRNDDGRVLDITVESIGLDDQHLRVAINGSKAPRVATPVHEIVRRAGISGRQWAASRPIELDQVAGAQAQLLLRAVKPVRRADRIEDIAEGIARMSREEASYWHAKADQPGGLAALRVLLTATRRL